MSRAQAASFEAAVRMRRFRDAMREIAVAPAWMAPAIGAACRAHCETSRHAEDARAAIDHQVDRELEEIERRSVRRAHRLQVLEIPESFTLNRGDRLQMVIMPVQSFGADGELRTEPAVVVPIRWWERWCARARRRSGRGA